MPSASPPGALAGETAKIRLRVNLDAKSMATIDRYLLGEIALSPVYVESTPAGRYCD